MDVMIQSIARSVRRNAGPSRRQLSAPPKKEVRILTKEEVALQAAYVEKHKNFIANSPQPKTFVSGPALPDLYVPAPAPDAANSLSVSPTSELPALSGMPQVHQGRTVRIHPRLHSTMQSGDKNVQQWQISWQTGERWSNPLMGWTSSSDPHSGMKLSFNSREDAIAFAERSGWRYEVSRPVTPQCSTPGEKSYAHNFLAAKIQNRLAREGNQSKEFANPKYGSSHWFMPLTYHGDREVEQHGPRPTAAAATTK